MRVKTLRALATEIGVTHPAVLYAKREGRITPEPDGTWDVEKVRRQWRANTDPTKGRSRFKEAAPEKGERRLPTIHEVAMIERRARAEMAVMELRHRKGELVEKADVEKDAAEMYTRVRERLLTMPDRVDAILAACTEPAEINRLLREEVEQALTELSSGG